MVKDLETKFKYPIAGSLRIGERNEKNIPQKLDYFTVHEDTHTIDNVVKQFNSKYNNPKELIIKFLTDDPLEVSYIRYGKSEDEKLKDISLKAVEDEMKVMFKIYKRVNIVEIAKSTIKSDNILRKQ